MAPHLRIPTSEYAGTMDCPFKIDKQGKVALRIDGSAEWIHMIGPIGIYYIHQLDICPMYKKAFTEMLNWMMLLRRRYANVDSVDPNNTHETASFERVGRKCMARLESMMPVHFCTLVFHLMSHTVSRIADTGPVHGTWMFVFERWIQIAKRVLKSRKSPVEGLMRGMMKEEWTAVERHTTEKDLADLLRPPLSHFTQGRIVTPLGIVKNELVLQVTHAHFCYTRSCA